MASIERTFMLAVIWMKAGIAKYKLAFKVAMHVKCLVVDQIVDFEINVKNNKKTAIFMIILLLILHLPC